MKNTEKYQLNLIEKDDVFSPDPLNENMERVEEALDAVRAEADAGDAAVLAQAAEADAALDRRLQVFEAHHVAYGTYLVEESVTDIDVGFSPSLVIISGVTIASVGGILIPERPHLAGEITETGFRIKTGSGTGSLDRNYWYFYIALN